MLLTYKYVWDDIRHVQSFVNYIMLEVILKSPKLAVSELNGNVVIKKYWTLIQGVNPDLLLNPLSELFVICKGLDRDKIKLLKRAVLVNNRITGLCAGKLNPVRYNDLKSVFIANDDKKVPDLIKTICNNLYEKCLDRTAFTSKYGTLKSHYDKIVGKDSRCRACGITQRMLTKHSRYRNAFDHYLPKGIYPFVSVNFFNLIPTCDICNGKYKATKDTLLYKTRKKAFYPYSNKEYDIQVSVILHSSEILNLTPSDVDIKFSCIGRGDDYDYQEELKNWCRVYGIEEQYKSFCCSYSCVSLLSEIIGYGIDDIRAIVKMMENTKEIDSNFLKLAMLKGVMDRLGIEY